MYTLQTPNSTIGELPYPMENTGFTRVESRDFLPIHELFNIYQTQKLVAKRQANPKTKRNNVLRMEQILTHYGIDCTKDDIRQFARKLKTDFRFARIGSHGVDRMRCAKHARSSRKDGLQGIVS